MIVTAKTNQHRPVLLAGRIAWVVGLVLLLILVIWRLLTGIYVQDVANGYLVGLSLPSVTPFVSSDTFFLYLTILSHSALALFWLVAALVFWRKPQDWIALLVSSVLLLMPITLTLEGGDAPWQTLLTFLGLAFFFLLLFVFPDGRFIPQTTLSRFLLGLIILLTPFLSFAMISAFQPEYAPDEQGYFAFMFMLGVIMLSGVSSQLYRYRYIANPSQRQQTRWVLFGLSSLLVWISWWLLLWATDLLAVLGISESTQALIGLHINIFVPLLLPVTFGVAILRHGLWSSTPLINRALVYGMLSAIIIILYIFLVGALGVLFQTRGSLLIALLATGVVAVIFQPLRSRLQQSANRLMYGERDDPVGVLTRLASQLETAESTEALLPNMVESIAAALKLPYVAIWLPETEGERWRKAASVGEQPRHTEMLPIRYNNQEIARLLVAPRSPGEQLSQADKRLLGNITLLVATTIRALQLNEQLQQSRQNLVATREEERRRIRRDLHDGLGPVLASITLQAGTAMDLVRSDPAEATALLQKITAKAQKSVIEIRHLVYGLRPPALDELGLEGAIGQFISSMGPGDLLFTIETPDELPTLPAAVEVAAYRIVQEAITNIVNHAQATSCFVRLTGENELCLEITDNGIGLPDGRSTGIGLRSMRERASELGGACWIESAPGGGTKVFARLPLVDPKE